MLRRMNPMTLLRCITFGLAALLIGVTLGGCGERPPLPGPVATLSGPYKLDTKDALRIVVYDQPSLTNIYEINQAGNIAMPLIGDVEARGSTTDEMRSKIAGRLAASYLRNPDVSVEVATYRPFFVLGEVNNPGQYPYVPAITAETAIAVAGGFTDRANMRTVRISRSTGGKLYESRIAVTEAIRPGDTIYVSERLF
jgi:polysaccharide export outer membrane protein